MEGPYDLPALVWGGGAFQLPNSPGRYIVLWQQKPEPFNRTASATHHAPFVGRGTGHPFPEPKDNMLYLRVGGCISYVYGGHAYLVWPRLEVAIALLLCYTLLTQSVSLFLPSRGPEEELTKK